ncbi:MAG: ABC transporter ATP-binding protein [Myxococcaceae bacterium]|nr:ABC transporter ATP-binding protein [Myxococcaceae bacterium]MBH2005992.1 ABC transporter ATP-binding protein [Myxococcaceae bacterium]
MTVFRRFFQYTAFERARIVRAILYSVANKFFDILPEILIGVAVDVVVKRDQSFLGSMGILNLQHQLLILGGVTLLIWGFESLFDYLKSIEWRNLAQVIQHSLRRDVFAHAQKLPMSYFEEKNTGSLLSIMNDDVNQLERFLDGGANSIIQTAVSTVFVAVIFFFLAPGVAAMALMPIPLILAGAYYFQRHLGPCYLNVRERAGALSERLHNTLSGVAVVKSYAAEEYELGRLEADSEAYAEANRSAIVWSSAYIPMVRMAIVIGFIATIVFGGHLALSGQLSIGAYSVLVFLTQRLLWPFTDLAETTDLFQRGMASAKRALDLLETPIPKDSGLVAAVVHAPIAIGFQEISLQYPNGVHGLKNLSLQISAGETVALVGPTGSGKSSMIKLLLRFYEPTSGSIIWGQESIKTLSLETLRRSIGFVSQDVFLFHGSIRENIAYGSFGASDQEIRQAAEMAEAHHFIDQLPQGYDTIIGERGQKLSGGQRQRISIARAILKDPPVFIFDEATSAIDNETEAAIQRSIQQVSKGRTTILVAHRLSTIRHSHRILVLEAGQLIQTGSHEQLIEEQGLYQKLWKIQTGMLLS